MLIYDHFPLSARHHAARVDLLLLGAIHQGVAAAVVGGVVQAQRLDVVQLLHDCQVVLFLVQVADDVGSLAVVFLVFDSARNLNLMRIA